MNTSFEKAGPKNTGQTLEILRHGVEHHGVKQVVVASTFGDTGLTVARMLAGQGISLVVVTHNTGFREPGKLEMPPEIRAELESLGAKVHTGTMAFRNIGTSIREKHGYSEQDLIANTLRLFGQGVKVCVEIAMMAADAGLITPDDVLAVAGTGRGADTVALISPQSTNRLFDLKIRQILVKPAAW